MKVKKQFLWISLFLLGLQFSHAQQHSVERIYLATDREFYVAGESIWLSLFCFDMNCAAPQLSNLSSVAYIELRNEASLMEGAKIAILNGRGSGKIEIPLSLPTGNYRLIAYTKQMLNQNRVVLFDKIIPVFNTLSTGRLPGTQFVHDDSLFVKNKNHASDSSEYIDLQFLNSQTTFQKNSIIPLSLKNRSNEAITMTISIARMDNPAHNDYTLNDFLANCASIPEHGTFSQKYIPEYEGEIIQGRVIAKEAPDSENNFVSLSVVGSGFDVYLSPIDVHTGEFAFFTHSIYGDREIVLALPSVEESSFEIFDSFAKPPLAPAPPLFIDNKSESFLTQRSVEMQINHRFATDMLNVDFKIPNDPILSYEPIVYQLDNYTRFPSMEDVMIEFVTELRFRKINNRPRLQILQKTPTGWIFGGNNLMVTIDGIAIFDHEQLFLYNPHKVKTISIYNRIFQIGDKIFDGIVQFESYKGDYPDLSLKKNNLIFDFKGMKYPCKFVEIQHEVSHLPDLRRLLYWDPQVDLTQGEQVSISVKTSLVSGDYAVVLEGVTKSGKAIYHKFEFMVE